MGASRINFGGYMPAEIRFRASRNVIVEGTGEPSTQEKFYDIYNAPGEVVKEMLTSSEPIIVYNNWLDTLCEPYEKHDPKYLKDLLRAANECERQLDRWLSLMKKEGYTIDVVEL